MEACAGRRVDRVRVQQGDVILMFATARHRGVSQPLQDNLSFFTTWTAPPGHRDPDPLEFYLDLPPSDPEKFWPAGRN